MEKVFNNRCLLLMMDKPWLSLLLLCVLGLTSLMVNSEAELFAERSFRAGFFLKSFPGMSRADLETVVKYWGEELGRKHNIPVEIRFYEEIAKMRTDFEQGDINFISGASWLLATAFQRNLMIDGFKVSRSGTALDNLILVTRKDEALSDFKKLADKKLGLLNGDQIAEVYLDVYSLTHFSKPYKQIFQKPAERGKSMQLVINLFFKKIDVIVIYQRLYEVAMELNPQIREQTQILASVPDITWGLGFFHKNVPLEFRELIIKGASEVNNTARGRQLLQLFHGDKFERSKLIDLQSIDELKNQYENLLKKHL